MGTTKIEWADASWNPITGCTKISPACDHCYAERMAKRLAGRGGYPKDEPFRVTFHQNKIDEPLHWKKPRRIFVVSMGDLFHDKVNPVWRDKVWAMMLICPQHTFLILTKRPKNMVAYLTQYQTARAAAWAGYAINLFGYEDNGDIPPITLPNVHLGVTVEDQQRADERIPLLLQCPAAVRFVSYEPALGPVNFNRLPCDITKWKCGHESVAFVGDYFPERFANKNVEDMNDPGWNTCCGKCGCEETIPLIHGIIAGGETGPGARQADPNWFRSVRDQCQAAGVPFFFKQWGKIVPFNQLPGRVSNDDRPVNIADKSLAGRFLDGREHNELPGVKS